MNYKEQKLWDAIREFEMDDDEAVYTFSDRLAKENKWSKGFTLRAIEEYKKFIFLICTSHQPRTPSDQVDQVWHLHLLYTRSYWIDFCKEVVKREIHHGPTRGGPEETEKFKNAYEQTLQHYRDTFRCEPPPDLWPSSSRTSSSLRLAAAVFKSIKYYYDKIITYADTSRKSADQKMRHRIKTRDLESNAGRLVAQASLENSHRTKTV